MTEARWLDADERRAWRAYVRMHEQLDARLNRELQADSGLSLADFEVLVLLTDPADGRRRPYELERELGWQQSRVSHQLTRMERRGLLTREYCPMDRRGAYLAITPAGRRAIEDAAPAHVETVRRLFFDPLAAAHVAQLEQMANLVLERIAADGEACPAS